MSKEGRIKDTATSERQSLNDLGSRLYFPKGNIFKYAETQRRTAAEERWQRTSPEAIKQQIENGEIG